MDQPSEVIARFRKMVAAGESPRLAEMMAVRKGPVLDTDTAHFVGLPPLEKVYGPVGAKKIRETARKAGISVSDSSFFNPSIADERAAADPDAWLLPGEGKDKFKRVIRDRGGASEELGVEFGESQQRMDTEQKRLEKLRANKKEYKKLQKQVAADMPQKA